MGSDGQTVVIMGLVLPGMAEQIRNRDPSDQANRLIIEWTSALRRQSWDR
jgi:hypothetical protein